MRAPRLQSDRRYDSMGEEYGSGMRDGITRFTFWGGVAVFVVALVQMRHMASQWSSPDFSVYLVPWYQHLKQVGFHQGFHTAFASYNMPYLYLLWFGGVLNLGAHATVKGIANGFDLLLAFGIYRLVSGFVGRQRGILAAGLVLLLPTIWFNSAVWGQVDAMYTCFVLFSLDQVLRKHQKWAWFWWGVAFAMKMQAIFFLPWLIVAFMVNRRRDWLAPLLALVFPIGSLLPAALCGMTLKDMTSAYVGQATSTPFLNKAPTFWLLTSGGGISPMKLYPACIWVTLAILAGFAVALVQRNQWALDPRRMVSSAAAMALIMPYFLPNMRNRYFYVAEILIIVWAFIRPERWWVCLLMEIAIFLTYPLNLMRLQPVLTSPFWSLVIAVVLVMMVRDSLILQPVTDVTPHTGATAADAVRPAELATGRTLREERVDQTAPAASAPEAGAPEVSAPEVSDGSGAGATAAGR